MERKTKTSVIILAILTIILIANVWAIRDNSGPKKMDCNTDCRSTGGKKWTFPGGGPKAYFFDTEDECIRACQLKNR